MQDDSGDKFPVKIWLLIKLVLLLKVGMWLALGFLFMNYAVRPYLSGFWEIFTGVIVVVFIWGKIQRSLLAFLGVHEKL